MRFLPPIHGLGHKLRKTVTPHFIFVKDILLLFIVLEAHSPSFSEVKVDFFSSPSGKTWVWFFSGSFRCRFGFPGSTFEGSNGSLFFLHTDVAAMDLLLFNAVASALLLTNFYHNGPNDLTFFAIAYSTQNILNFRWHREWSFCNFWCRNFTFCLRCCKLAIITRTSNECRRMRKAPLFPTLSRMQN